MKDGVAVMAMALWLVLGSTALALDKPGEDIRRRPGQPRNPASDQALFTDSAIRTGIVCDRRGRTAQHFGCKSILGVGPD